MAKCACGDADCKSTVFFGEDGCGSHYIIADKRGASVMVYVDLAGAVELRDQLSKYIRRLKRGRKGSGEDHS